MTTARDARTSVEVIVTPAGVKTRLARSSVEVLYRYKPNIDIDIYLSAASDMRIRKDIGGSISAEITVGPALLRKRVDIRGSLDFEITLEHKVVPPNDKFSGAVTVDFSTGSYSSEPLDTTNLTREATEPAGRYRSAWWKFTPTTTGWYAIDTFGSLESTPEDSLDELDTVLTVFTGSSVDALTQVAYNDDSDFMYEGEWSSNSYIPSVSLTAGTTYYIRVESYQANDTGTYVLNVASSVMQDGATAALSLTTSSGTFSLDPIQEGATAQLTLHATAGGVWIPPVYVTQLPPRVRYPQPVYSFVLFEPMTGTIITELEDATNKSVSVKLKDASTASFQLSYMSPNNALISPLATGLLVYRNDLNIFSGLLGPSQGTIQSGSHTISYIAEDYRGVLKRRKIFNEDIIAKYGMTDDGEALGWSMIDTVQKRENGNLGIVRASGGAIGSPGYFKATPNDSVFQLIQTLAGSGQTFDWDVLWQDGRLYYYAWAVRGEEVTYAFDIGGSVVSMTYTFAPENFGNVVRLQGAGGLQSNAISQFLDSAPRLELAVSDDSMKTQSQVDARAQGLLATSKNLTPTYSVKLSAAMWDPEQLWLGDTAVIDVLPGRRDKVRVMEINLSIGNGEDITVNLGIPIPNLIQRVAGTYDRVARTESAVSQKAKTYFGYSVPPSGAGIGDFWTPTGDD